MPPAARLASRVAPNQCHDPEEITPVSHNARLALHRTFSGITSDSQEKNKRERNTFVCEEGNHICFVPYCTLILWGEMQNIPNIICRTIKHKQASTFVFAFTQRWKWENIKTRSLWFISELYSDIWLKHSMLLWQVTRIRAWNTQQSLQH